MVQRWTQRGEEPTVTDLMRDPLTHAVMRCDGVGLRELWAVIDEARRNLAGQRDQVLEGRVRGQSGMWFQPYGREALPRHHRPDIGCEHG